LIDLMTLLDRGVLRLKVPDSVFERAEALKAAMPRSSIFLNLSADTMHKQLPVWIVSLARATQRRQHMIGQIKAAGAWCWVCCRGSAEPHHLVASLTAACARVLP
jgi:hypothetical protein